MLEKKHYSISVEERDIIVKFRREAIAIEDLTRFLDYLELESIRKRSQLTEEDASQLAAEIDRDIWANIKSSFLGD